MHKSKRLEALESRIAVLPDGGRSRERLLEAIETIIERQTGFEAPDGWFDSASPIEIAAYAMKEDTAPSVACVERMTALADQDTPTGNLFKALIAGMEMAAKNNPNIQARS